MYRKTKDYTYTGHSSIVAEFVTWAKGRDFPLNRSAAELFIRSDAVHGEINAADMAYAVRTFATTR